MNKIACWAYSAYKVKKKFRTKRTSYKKSGTVNKKLMNASSTQNKPSAMNRPLAADCYMYRR